MTSSQKVFNSGVGDYPVQVEIDSNGQRQIVSTTERYAVSNIDKTSDPKYYGYLARDGSWYIMKNTSDSEFTYIFGTSDYTTNWANRASLSYQLYNLAYPSEV